MVQVSTRKTYGRSKQDWTLLLILPPTVNSERSLRNFRFYSLEIMRSAQSWWSQMLYLVTLMHIEFGLFCFHDHCSSPFLDIFTRLGLIYCGCDKLGYQVLLFICNRTMIWISPQMRCFHLEWKIIILLHWAYLSQCQVMLKNMQYDTLKIMESE